MTSTSLHLPGVGAPLRRALAEAGYTELAQLDGANYRHLLSLHGVGVKGLGRLLSALRETGGDMLEAPTPEEIQALAPSVTITAGHTGKVASDIKTKPTDLDPRAFCESVEWPVRRADGLELLQIFSHITGQEPVMWGPTMVGFGQVHYESSSGRHGDWFKIGFSPRKASLTLYGMQGAGRFEELVAHLGKHRLGAGCLYITSLKQVDRKVLVQLIEEAWAAPLDG
ncbi:DUF1801 domain-containing protein [Rothia nasimurium]|uniref:DUF1801 domain-containing protein n=1 Tax=Rothia nasimurium TaxID=85336 RepID=UPI003B9F245D